MKTAALISLERNPDIQKWLRFDPSLHRVVVRTGKVELGQGILMPFCQIAAAAMGLSASQVAIESGSTDTCPNEGWTSGSVSTEHTGSALGIVCQSAALALREFGAATLRCKPESLSLAEGFIVRDGRSTGLSYWSFGARLFPRIQALTSGILEGRLPAPNLDCRPADGSYFKVDVRARLGGAYFLQDLELPDVLHARILRHRRQNQRLAAINRDGIKALVGVHHVVVDGSFVAIVGSSESDLVAAMPAALHFLEWDTNGDTEHVLEEWIRSPRAQTPDISPGTLQFTFQRGFLTAASIGASTAFARWDDANRLEVWTHSQGVFAMQRQLASAFDLPLEKIVVRHRASAGCYGHNGADDSAFDAAIIARHLPERWIRVAWTREQELAHSPMGSAMQVEISARVNEHGRITGWESHTKSGTHAGRPGWGTGVKFLAGRDLAIGLDSGDLTDIPPDMGSGALRNAWPAYCGDLARPTLELVDLRQRTSSLRSLGAHVQVMAIESVVDELASLCDVDPVEFRLRNLSDERACAVIRLVAQRCSWSKRHSRDQSLGFGFARYKNKAAYAAIVVALDLTRDVRVTHVWAAIDAGAIVNRNGLLNQIEGGVIQALSWTLKEEVTWDRDGCSSADWEHYPIFKFADIPTVEIDLIEHPDDVPLGVGEVAAGPTAAAVANALAAGLGVRLTRMPFTRERIVAALV